MLFDRCILTKRNNEWIGIAELRKRVGEKWRFAAWVMLIIACIELFRLAMAGFWYFSGFEYAILVISVFFFIAFYRRSSKTYKYREDVIRIPRPEPVLDEVGQVLGYRQLLYILKEGEYKVFDVNRFTHVVRADRLSLAGSQRRVDRCICSISGRKGWNTSGRRGRLLR